MNLRKVREYRVNYFTIKGFWGEVCTQKEGYPITINGHVFFVGYIKERGTTGWRATERNTGTYIGKAGLSSFDAAVDAAVNDFRKNGENSFCKILTKLLKEKTILSSPKFLAQRHSDYTPILEFICNEDEKR